MDLYPYQQKLIDYMLRHPEVIVHAPRRSGLSATLAELELRMLSALDPATPGTDQTGTATGRYDGANFWIDEVTDYKPWPLPLPAPQRYNRAPRRQATTSYRARRRTDRRAHHAAKMANIRKARK